MTGRWSRSQSAQAEWRTSTREGGHPAPRGPDREASTRASAQQWALERLPHTGGQGRRTVRSTRHPHRGPRPPALRLKCPRAHTPRRRREGRLWLVRRPALHPARATMVAEAVGSWCRRPLPNSGLRWKIPLLPRRGRNSWRLLPASTRPVLPRGRTPSCPPPPRRALERPGRGFTALQQHGPAQGAAWTVQRRSQLPPSALTTAPSTTRDLPANRLLWIVRDRRPRAAPPREATPLLTGRVKLPRALRCACWLRKRRPSTRKRQLSRSRALRRPTLVRGAPAPREPQRRLGLCGPSAQCLRPLCRA